MAISALSIVARCAPGRTSSRAPGMPSARVRECGSTGVEGSSAPADDERRHGDRGEPVAVVPRRDRLAAARRSPRPAGRGDLPLSSATTSGCAAAHPGVNQRATTASAIDAVPPACDRGDPLDPRRAVGEVGGGAAQREAGQPLAGAPSRGTCRPSRPATARTTPPAPARGRRAARGRRRRGRPSRTGPAAPGSRRGRGGRCGSRGSARRARAAARHISTVDPSEPANTSTGASRGPSSAWCSLTGRTVVIDRRVASSASVGGVVILRSTETCSSQPVSARTCSTETPGCSAVSMSSLDSGSGSSTPRSVITRAGPRAAQAEHARGRRGRCRSRPR